MPLPPLKKVLPPIYHETGRRNEKFLYPDISPIRWIRGMITSVPTNHHGRLQHLTRRLRSGT